MQICIFGKGGLNFNVRNNTEVVAFSMDFSSVTVTFFIHSTEDETRLMSLVEERLGLEPAEISKVTVAGYFGNEIISVRSHIIGSKAQVAANRIVSQLSSVARSSILSEIERSLDEHDSLYLRLDRQSLQDSSLSISDEEPIRIKLKPKSRYGGRVSMKEQYEELIR